MAQEDGVCPAVIAAVIVCTSLINTNNVIYRFLLVMGKDYYDYQPAAIKMSFMICPEHGKEFFELLSLVI